MARDSRRRTSIRIPAEWEPHACCWMAWAVHREWSPREAARIRRDLTKVVRTIARFEPVRLLAPPGRAFHEARRRFSDCHPVTVIEAPVDDFWMRDIMPTFAIHSRGVSRQILAINWNFNGWGGTPDRPARAGDQLATSAAAEIFGVQRTTVSFVAEGGAFAFDGCGTVITTRSCLLNPNRNPVRRGVAADLAIASGLRELGIRKVIWLEGDPGEPITSGHVDGFVVWAPGGRILVEGIDDRDSEMPVSRERDIRVLEQSTNADGRSLRVVRLAPPRKRYRNGDRDLFAAAYLNVYITNGAVIGQRFGDPERDELARVALAKAFPGREVILLRIDAIAEGGGGVHCLTQPMPAI
ncbi:agmatine deiminase [Bradyrhizobium erythrophlei]|nr:agmatine deiminase [Bradyrhizobium erythrophlei]